MKLTFENCSDSLMQGIRELCNDYGFTVGDGGFPVTVKKADKLCVLSDGKSAEIRYSIKASFFRGLGHLLENFGKEINICESIYFDTCGAMIDLSHGAVLTVEAIKSVIRKNAVMGLNMIMLYREESYVVEGYPYFGYMRGRHTEDEIREIDDYADMFGVEILPAIQTLGHLSNTIRWKAFDEVADTYDCLLVGEEKTYEFIEAMIKCASRPLRSKRIHIGCDETLSLGMGKYIAKHGYRDRMDIYLEHLNRVTKICAKYGLEPIIWSDMFFRSASTTSYDSITTEIPPEMAKKIPENLSVLGYSYGLTDTEKVVTRIKGNQVAGRKTYFGGATIDWQGFCIDYNVTITATSALLEACKKCNIRDVVMTTWGDDSTERDYFLTLLGNQIYAEFMYNGKVDINDIKRRYSFCAVSDAEMVLDISDIDGFSQKPYNEAGTLDDGDTVYSTVNPSKYMMWQDPMMGLFDTEALKTDFPAHFKASMEKLKKYKGMKGNWDTTLDYYIALCDVLAVKSDIGVKMCRAYKDNNREELKKISEKLIPQIIEKTENFWVCHRNYWFTRHLPFGVEVIERRFGALILRLKTTQDRIDGYLDGRYKKLEELEEERLSPVCDDSENICFFNDWLLTSTAWGR